MPIRFELLGRGHDRRAFVSGVPALDDWFRTRATQDQRRRIAQVFVGVDEEGVDGASADNSFSGYGWTPSC